LVAQSTKPKTEVFSWPAEFVALDANARIMTVKARVVGEQGPAELGRAKPGEQLMLTWSGYDTFADAINHAGPLSEKKVDERFTFPAEFVSFDAAHQYVTFKVQIPENSVGSLKSLKPGEWVTATSPHGAASKQTPVSSVRPYVGSANTSSN